MQNRKNWIYPVLCSILFLFYSSQNFTQVINSNWQWLHPKPQGNVQRWCKMWDANTWFIAGNDGTFLKTTNGGQNWFINHDASKITNYFGQKGNIMDAHFFDLNNGILVNSGGGVTRTTNGGITFDSIPGLFTGTWGWNGIYFFNNNTGYIVGERGKVSKTTDGGISWNSILSIPNGNGIYYYDIYTYDNITILVGSYPGTILRSTDSGNNWDIISTGENNEIYDFAFVNRDTGMASGRYGIALLTTNGGLNWTSVRNGLPGSSFPDIDCKVSGNITEFYLTGNYQYIYKTTNLGANWDTVGFWNTGQTYMGLYHGNTNSDLGIGDTLLTVGSYGLINKRNSSSDRRLFTDFKRFFEPVYDIWVEESGEKIWVVGGPTIGGTTFDQIIHSSNGGESWSIQNTGNTAEKLTSIHMLNSNTGYISGNFGNIRKTTDSGLNWVLCTSPNSFNIFKIEFVNENSGWVFGDMGSVYKTTDGAVTWVQQAQNAIGSIYGSDIEDENVGWFCGVGGQLYNTTNGGTNWVQFNAGTTGTIYDIEMIGANTGYICGSNLLAKTTNGGSNWISLNLPFPQGSSYQFCSLDFINSNVGMILGLYNTLKTTNGGSSWIIDNLGTVSLIYSPEGNSKIKMIAEDTAFIGGYYSSVLKYSPQPPIGITEWQNTVPKEFTLFQNYPNPFNPSTTIRFAIPKPSKVLLKVYDITGREVRTIIDMELNAGTVTHQFDGSELASGIYFYSLYIDGTRIDTKKMVLVK